VTDRPNPTPSNPLASVLVDTIQLARDRALETIAAREQVTELLGMIYELNGKLDTERRVRLDTLEENRRLRAQLAE
jgi:hypothetical protein